MIIEKIIIKGVQMDFKVGQKVITKKPHPCSGNEWEILRVGMDFKLRCLNCGREIIVPRKKAEKAIKSEIK